MRHPDPTTIIHLTNTSFKTAFFNCNLTAFPVMQHWFWKPTEAGGFPEGLFMFPWNSQFFFSLWWSNWTRMVSTFWQAHWLSSNQSEVGVGAKLGCFFFFLALGTLRFFKQLGFVALNRPVSVKWLEMCLGEGWSLKSSENQCCPPEVRDVMYTHWIRAQECSPPSRVELEKERWWN